MVEDPPAGDQDEEPEAEGGGPATRLGRIFAIRQALANGTYTIASDEVAEKIMEAMLREQ